MKPVLVCVLLLLSACGAPDAAAPSDPAPAADADPAAAVGPVQTVALGPIDAALVEQGRELFQTRCSPCHKGADRYVGPALDGITERRSPVYIMNIILNPEGMLQGHPEVQKLFAEYSVPMTNQHLTEDEARTILEYFRSVDASDDDESDDDESDDDAS